MAESLTVVEKSTQLNKLQGLLHYLSNHSKYYQQLFSEKNIDINAITSLKEIEKLPFTCKDDLAKHLNTKAPVI